MMVLVKIKYWVNKNIGLCLNKSSKEILDEEDLRKFYLGLLKMKKKRPSMDVDRMMKYLYGFDYKRVLKK